MGGWVDGELCVHEESDIEEDRIECSELRTRAVA